VSAAAELCDSRAFARVNASRGSSRGRNDWCAASFTSDSRPNTATSAARVGSDSSPGQASSGTAHSSAARPRSVPTSSGLRRVRSASAPTSTPNSRYGSQRAALTRPTSAAEPDSVVTTSTWIASVVTGVPKSDTVLAVQKSRKPA